MVKFGPKGLAKAAKLTILSSNLVRGATEREDVTTPTHR